MKRITCLSWFQVIEFTSASYFPLTFWFFPRVAVTYSDLDGQWAVLGVIFFGFIMAFIHGVLNERFPTMAGTDMANTIFGRGIAFFANLAYVPVYIAFNAMCLFFFAIVLKSFFPNTPRYFLLLVLCLVALRGAWLGVESLARVASIVHPLTLFGVVVIFAMLIFQSKHLWLPHKVNSFPNTFQGIYHLFPLYLGFSSFLMISPYYRRKKGRSIWYPLISVASGSFAIAVCFIAVVSQLGWDAVKDLTLPVTFVIQLMRLQGGIIERIGILIVIFSTLYTVLFSSNVIWGVATHTARVFNLPDDDYKWFIIPVTLFTLWIAVSFHSEQQVFEFLDQYFVPTSWVLLLIVPMLLMLTAMFRKKRTNETNAS